MSEIYAINGFEKVSEIKDRSIREFKVESTDGVIKISEDINDIVSMDIGVNINKVNSIPFNDLYLFNIYCELTLVIFAEKKSGEVCFFKKKQIFTLKKNGYIQEKNFNVLPIDGYFMHESNEILYSLVVLLETIM